MYVYRVEFQCKGSPNVHGLAWIKVTPQLDVSSNKEVCSYIDKIIACTRNVSEDEQEYVQIQKQTFQDMSKN